MGYKNPTDSLRVLATGVNLTAGAASTSAALPVDSAGNTARYVRVTIAVGGAHVRVGASTVTAAATDTLIAEGGAVVLDCAGCTHIACIQDVSGGTVNVVPLEW